MARVVARAYPDAHKNGRLRPVNMGVPNDAQRLKVWFNRWP
jgi:hypothetical protein